MTLLTSLLQRQLVPSPLRGAFPVDFALEAFSCLKDDEHLVERREIDVPPFACRFNKTALGGHMLGIADEDGWVQILDSRKTGRRSIIKEWNAHENAVFDIAWMEGEQMLVTASGDQTVRMWDINRDHCLAVFKGHSCSVKTVDFREDDIFVFATGARDGNVMVWDMRCNRRSGQFYQPVNVISNAHAERLPGTPQTTKKKARRSSTPRPVMNSGQQSVTAVLFQGGEKLISAGAVDGKIKIWDLRKTYTNLKHQPVPYHIFPYPGQGLRKHGFSSLVLDSTHSRLFAGCTNDNIYMYSCTALGQEPLGTFSGHLNSTFYVKAALSPNDMYLVSGSSDNNAYIWRVTDPSAPPIILKGHLGEVTSVAWCPSDQGKVVTCSDDNSFRIWRIDHQACKGDKINLVGESCKRLQTSCYPGNDKIGPSRLQDRTPSSSPSRSPDAKRLLWTPPTKVITNPRLNQISSPVGVATTSPKSPLNRTPPKKQNILIQAPKVSTSPTNLKTGLPSQVSATNKATSPSPASPPLSLSHSPGCPVTQVSSLQSPPAVAKFPSPKQLLTSWLKTNSRKRTHSDSDDKTEHITKEVKPELKLKDVSDKDQMEKNLQNKVNTLLPSQNYQIQEHRTKENDLNGQKSPGTSPLRKRQCFSDQLNSMTHNNQELIAKPGKENCILRHGSSEVNKQVISDATLEVTSSHCVSIKSKAKVSAHTKPKNWLTEWSTHCNTKHGGKSIELELTEKGSENKHAETLNITNEIAKKDSPSSSSDLQPDITQVTENPKPGKSILTYFKRVNPN